MNITELPEAKSARVVAISGGAGLRKKLQDLGIREGTVVRKVTRLFTHGPIVVRAGSTEIALGRGMASKVEIQLI
ncbi:MAG: ferrous iron transport protein A [Candidatus Omnitrophica bacterium]|nr:ferrous iron transport protein A [Candidatus Omnitrophota bacterium]